MAIQEFTSRAKAREFIKQNGGHMVNPTAPWLVQYEPETEVAIGARQVQETAIKDLQARIVLVRKSADIDGLYQDLNNMAGSFAMSEAVVAALDEAIGARAMELEGEEALTQAQVASAPGNKPGWVHASTVLKPTKLVWAIADAMYEEARLNDEPMPTRKEVQDECVKRGIASGTARTQFQHWFKQRNESAKEARAQIVDGKIVPAK